MHPLTGLYNCWVVYWPPGGLDDTGEPVVTTPQVLKANWKENASRSIVVNGEQYVINDIAMLGTLVAEGGYLQRVSHVPVTTPHAAAVRLLTNGGTYAAHYASPPPGGRIRSVASQNTIKNHANVVYTAMM